MSSCYGVFLQVEISHVSQNLDESCSSILQDNEHEGDLQVQHEPCSQGFNQV